MQSKIRSISLFATVAFFGVCQMNAQQKNPGINLDFMDKSVKPGDDFFRYVNGTWVDKTEIPSDRVRWGSFDELRQNTDRDALDILKEAAANKKLDPNSDQAKAVNVFQTYMDTISRNKLGINPIKETLAKINAIKSVNDLNKLITEMQPEGGLGFYGIGVGPDAKNSNRNVVNIGLGSLGLADRDYYVSDEADSKEKREKYVLHVAKMLQFLGDKPDVALANAKKVLAIETAMATPRLDRVERRDRRKTYNPMSVADLQKLTPSVNWNNYIKGVGLPAVDSVIVSQPKYMTSLETVFKENKIEEWKAYLRWTLLNNSSNVLTTEIEKANWDFYSKTLQGAKAQRPREERALQVVNGTVGEALGKLYVEKKFPAEAKEKAKKMIENVFLAFENRINNLPWMTPETRKGAIEKLKKSKVKIGYPDKWKDYSKLVIKSKENGGSYYENMKNVSKWGFQENIADLNKPVDKTRWGMSPQTVNAYYNASYNEIVFPAAILQPPFYDYKADEAVNYGGIGAVIGHEISHGFDDSGSRYNADGNLVNWWTEDDLKQFTGLGGALAAQYSALEPIPGTFVDGKFTLGENIGDLGGINAAYDGLQIHLKQNGNPGLIDGYTPEQRLFISWATIWRTKIRDEAIKNFVKTDTHSPGMYRAYVPLQNVDSFYKAFDIKETDKLYVKPENRVKIW
ncbi:M13 family metallopeptidase [Flavobacterium aquatile]|uniref:Endothelin-converting protein n=1 Tax=Flavobacterium aquatile LMG 4008 = ATCC 11947 TaxID=1453498 RepID=A0A095SWA3_9FLAO|nr:endothelin-converting protein [Flavobacterium aquatile LMG 4008 = ATCC 11947]OXA69393.1 endothelin-converting protein [Flavobacterium aquatile LMG 4008 = ATCC 11947]GEC79366.1 endothelin-converting protein [Flavobacterium aquatile]